MYVCGICSAHPIYCKHIPTFSVVYSVNTYIILCYTVGRQPKYLQKECLLLSNNKIPTSTYVQYASTYISRVDAILNFSCALDLLLITHDTTVHFISLVV